MKYAIISIDDSRKEFTDRIHADMAGYEQVEVECLDARPPHVDLDTELNRLGLRFSNRWRHLQPKRGDIGGFIGHFNAWRKCVELDDWLVVFEDDAIIPNRGVHDLTVPGNIRLANSVTGGFDFMSLCVNDYGKMFYDHVVEFDADGFHYRHHPRAYGEYNQFEIGDGLAYVYQPWTLTAALYSPKAATYLIKKIQQTGLYMNADAFVMHQARLQKFKAIAPVPSIADNIVRFNEGHSIIQSAEE